MNEVILGIGFNIDKRKSKIDEINNDISESIGNIINSSSLYETQSWGKLDNDSFWNWIWQVKTRLLPLEILKQIFEIENKWNRIRTEKNAARTLDIDILMYNNIVFQKQVIINNTKHQLVIPHQLLHQRNFVLIPMCEILCKKKHPVFNKNMLELLEVCSDKLQVQNIGPISFKI